MKLTMTQSLLTLAALVGFLTVAPLSNSSAAPTGLPADEPLIVHISSDDQPTADMALNLADNMQKQGKDVTIFFDVRGVKAAVKNPPKELSAVSTRVKDFLSDGGKVIVCPSCLGVAGFVADDLLPGAEVGGPARMAKLLDGHVAVISY